MPYNHAGEIGDVWKHLPLCDILKIEKPARYRESNSAYSGYIISSKPQTEYGILKMLGLNNREFMNSMYYSTLKANGIDNFSYTGSPGLAMSILFEKTRYYFHDLEQEALSDIEAFALRKGLHEHVKTFYGDSVHAFMDKDYHIDGNDFIFLDPYDPFDISEIAGFSFFDIFKKAIIAKSKTVLWYGYESLNGQQAIFEKLREIASETNVSIYSFDVWVKSMDARGCELNPGVPGCGLACATLSNESIAVLKKNLNLLRTVTLMRHSAAVKPYY